MNININSTSTKKTHKTDLPEYERALRWHFHGWVRRSGGGGRQLSAAAWWACLTAQQPSETGRFCTSEATRPQHVTVIHGARLSTITPAQLLVPTGAPTPHFHLRDEASGVGLKSTLCRSRQTSVTSIALAFAALTPAYRWALKKNKTGFKFDMACKQIELVCRGNVRRAVKRSMVHPCGRAESYPSACLRFGWKYSTWERRTSRDKSTLQPVGCP